MDIRSTLAAQQYSASRPATAPDPETGQGGANLGQMARDFAAELEGGDQAAQAALTGRADSHALVTALAQTEFAVEAAVTVRDKVVEAYQEILRMPV
jgi:flagellar hook-basal body complex protein FliE